MRLDKYISYAGYGTRSEVKKLIRNGHVLIFGKIIKDGGYILSDEEKGAVQVNGEATKASDSLYYMLHKPDGFLTAIGDKRLPAISEFIPDPLLFKGLSPVGRLDYHTTGLLLLTNDGTLSHRLTSPKWHIEKEYEIQYEGESLRQKEIDLFSEGLRIQEKNSPPLSFLPAKLKILEEKRALLTIQEGKTHQIKRMFSAVNRPIVTLHRTRIGKIQLSDLPLGELRALQEDEVLLLKEDAQMIK